MLIGDEKSSLLELSPSGQVLSLRADPLTPRLDPLANTQLSGYPKGWTFQAGPVDGISFSSQNFGKNHSADPFSSELQEARML